MPSSRPTRSKQRSKELPDNSKSKFTLQSFVRAFPSAPELTYFQPGLLAALPPAIAEITEAAMFKTVFRPDCRPNGQNLLALLSGRIIDRPLWAYFDIVGRAGELRTS